jgi:hypothetical protein
MSGHTQVLQIEKSSKHLVKLFFITLKNLMRSFSVKSEETHISSDLIPNFRCKNIDALKKWLPRYKKAIKFKWGLFGEKFSLAPLGTKWEAVLFSIKCPNSSLGNVLISV